MSGTGYWPHGLPRGPSRPASLPPPPVAQFPRGAEPAQIPHAQVSPPPRGAQTDPITVFLVARAPQE